MTAKKKATRKTAAKKKATTKTPDRKRNETKTVDGRSKTQFKPGGEGGPGRPPGVPNKATREVRELAQSVVENIDAVRALGERARVELGDFKLRAMPATTLLFGYAFGKPSQRIEHEGSAVDLLRNVLTDAAIEAIEGEEE